MPTLRDLIDRALLRHHTQSINQLAKIGQRADYNITQTTLSQIHNGTYRSRPKRATLEAIAYLAGVTIGDAHRAADLPPPGVPYQPPPGADRLTAKERDIVNAVIRGLLEAREAPRPDGEED